MKIHFTCFMIKHEFTESDCVVIRIISLIIVYDVFFEALLTGQQSSIISSEMNICLVPFFLDIIILMIFLMN